MTTQLPALCMSCRHLTPSRDETGARQLLTCAAYPGGIPADIGRGADHRSPRGDERDGLTYSQADGQAAGIDLRAWLAFSAA